MGRRTMSHRTLRGNPIPVIEYPTVAFIAKRALQAVVARRPAHNVSFLPDLAEAPYPLSVEVVAIDFLPADDVVEQCAIDQFAAAVWAKDPSAFGQWPERDTDDMAQALDLAAGVSVRAIRRGEMLALEATVGFSW